MRRLASNKVLLIAAAAVVAIALVLTFVVFPSGSLDSDAAMLDRVGEKAERGSPKVLASRDWGGGRLVLASYDRRGEHRLGLAYVADELRGWRVRSYTESPIEITDVVVGSLLTATSGGGAGAPEWSAVVGELADPRIEQVEVEWTAGDPTIGPRSGDGYIVVREGKAEAEQVRYLASDGSEIATVPVSS